MQPKAQRRGDLYIKRSERAIGARGKGPDAATHIQSRAAGVFVLRRGDVNFRASSGLLAAIFFGSFSTARHGEAELY